MVTKLKAENPDLDEMTIISKLVGYTSDQVIYEILVPRTVSEK